MKTLSAEQEAVVNSDAPVTCVIASPGSGKTQTLATRIQCRIAAGVDPARMAVMSFTNSGAHEFSLRLQGLGVPRLGYQGTLHGWCLRLLQKHGDLIVYKAATISLVTEEQRDAMIHHQACKLFPKKGKPGETTLLQKHLKAKRKEWTPEVSLVMGAYLRDAKINNVVDYDGVLESAATMLSHSSVTAGAGIDDLSVDEVQDSGEVDWAIYIRIPAARKFYIGDPDQSCFAFRGAQPHLFEGMARIGGQSKEFATFTLEDNYRSASAITDAANNLIAHNPHAIQKWTRPMREGGHVYCVTYGNDSSERSGIASLINEHYASDDLLFGDIAVLTRNNDLTSEIRDELRRAGIPVAEPARVEMPHDWELTLATVALMHNPMNDLVAERWLRAAGATDADIARGRTDAAINGVGLLENWKGADARPFTKPVLLCDVAEQLIRRSISRESVYLVEQRIAILPQPEPTTGDLLADLWRHQEWGRGETGAGVHVGTIHGFKGREATLVIVAGMEEGTLPGRGNLEEERRLAFVAFTRAKETLYLTSVATRWKYGKPEACEPSRFIQEAGL